MGSPDLITVLFDIDCTHGNEPPSPADVAAWCARFPAHARAIRRYVTAWVRRDLRNNRVPLHYRTLRQS